MIDIITEIILIRYSLENIFEYHDEVDRLFHEQIREQDQQQR